MERGSGGDLRTIGYSPKTYDTFSSARAADYRALA